MNKPINISAIVPCYNDASQLVNIFKALKSASLIDEIILVDDGSNKATKKIIQTLTGTSVITHEKNLGKTAALYTGLSHSSGKHLFFLDADLRGLTGNLIDGMIKSYLANKPTMLLGERKTFLLFHLTGLELVFTGERILSRDFLLKNSDIFKYPGYLFEPVTNKLIFGEYSTYRYRLAGVRQKNKIYKRGLTGLWEDVLMHKKYVQYLGIKGYLWQCWYSKNRIALLH